jgi:hypothetical protein
MAPREILPIFLLSIVIIALIGTIGYFQTQTDNAHKQASNLEVQLNSLQNPTYNVTIANVSAADSWSPIVGLTLEKTFYITIKNNGDTDIGVLTTKTEVFDNGNVTNSGELFTDTITPPQLSFLHANESALIYVDVYANLGVSLDGKNVVFTLILDTTVLDKCTLNLGSRVTL